MKNSITLVNIILWVIIACSTFQLHAQEKQYEIRRKVLDVGVYDYSKVQKKKTYKIYYEAEAEEKFSKLLMSDDRLRSTNAFGQYMDQEDGSTVFLRELDAEEYCPELNYVQLIGGHGYISIYDLETLEEIYTNPSTHVYSPSGKYRFGTFEFDGMSFFIEIKQGGKYVPYLLAKSANKDFISGVYWHDDETMHYLMEKKGADDSIYWIGYSAKLYKVGNNK